MLLKTSRYVHLVAVSILVLFRTLIIPDTAIAQTDNSQKIYIYSSYSYEQEWSSNLARSLKSSIESQDSTVRVFVDYVGAEKMNSFLATRYGMQTVFMRNPQLPSLIIMIGEEAWMTYRAMTLRGWSRIPVILCYVDQAILNPYIDFFKDDRTIDQNKMTPIVGSHEEVRFTGVFANDNTRQTIELINTVVPNAGKLIMISESNYKDVLYESRIKNVLSEHYPDLSLEVVYDNVLNRDSILNSLSSLSKNDVLLLNNWYSKLVKARATSPEVDRFFKSPDAPPIFTFVDKNSKDSLIIGGVYPDMKDVIFQTKDLAFRVLKGEDPFLIPFTSSYNTTQINKLASQYRGIYPAVKELADVNFYNNPEHFFRRYFRQFFFVTVLFIIIILTLLFYRRDKRYKEYLRLSLEKYKVLYDEFNVAYNNMPAGLILLDKKGNVIRSNPEVEIYKNLLINNYNTQLEHISKFDFPEEFFEKLKHREELDITFGQDGINYSGEIIKYYFRVIAKYPDNNNILLIFLDISNIQREKISRKKTRQLLEFAMNKSELGVAEYNLLTSSGFATGAWFKNLRIENSSDYSDIYRFLNSDDKVKVREFFSDVRKGIRNVFIDSLRIEYNRNTFWIRCVTRVTEYSPEENRIMVVDMNWSIDDQKKREEDLESTLRKARESEVLKNGFIANMSNEINTPLNAIIAYSDLICDSEDVEEKQSLFKHIEENNASLLKLVSDIIDLSKIESDTASFKFVETNLHLLIREIASEVESKVDRDRIKVLIEIKGSKNIILADTLRLNQVISKFTSNAIKYTRQGFIKIGYSISGNQLYVYVQDTGTGIDAEKQKLLSNNLSGDGTSFREFGLGLQISKSIVNKLSGSMGFESKEGCGSTFWFRVPVKTVEKHSIE